MEAIPADVKRTSVVRRIPPSGAVRYRVAPGFEGDVGVFELARNAPPIVVEAANGRAMTLAPGDIFLAAPGYRESTRWVVGGIPDGGLVPGSDYWVLSDSGVIGDLFGNSPREKGHLGQAKFLGIVCNGRGDAANIRQFAESVSVPADRGALLFLVLGTSSEVGKTTAGIAILRSLRQQGRASLIALKATGTSSLVEISMYRDFGARQAFDCVDFGLPTTYPSERKGIDQVFTTALDVCLSISADAVVMECGGDLLGANVPAFVTCLKERRSAPKIILAAADALAALGAKTVLHQMGLSIDLITGPCTDTPTIRQRTQALCEIPAVNMAERGGQDAAI
jgi:hypothetical protein